MPSELRGHGQTAKQRFAFPEAKRRIRTRARFDQVESRKDRIDLGAGFSQSDPLDQQTEQGSWRFEEIPRLSKPTLCPVGCQGKWEHRSECSDADAYGGNTEYPRCGKRTMVSTRAGKRLTSIVARSSETNTPSLRLPRIRFLIPAGNLRSRTRPFAVI